MIPIDKQAHFWAGAAIFSTVTLYTANPVAGWFACIGAAAAKELYDMTGRGTPDVWDFLWTVAGGAFCVIFAVALVMVNKMETFDSISCSQIHIGGNVVEAQILTADELVESRERK